MNLISKIGKFAMMIALVAGIASCNNEKQNSTKPSAAGAEKPAQASESMVIRYVDADSIMAQYNLAKDFNEAGITMQNNYDAASKAQQKTIANMEQEFAAKEKRNVYATDPAQAQADQARYQKAVNDAQKKLGDMQNNMAKQMQQNQQQLNDSVENFLKDYAKQKGFDMILNKAATFYVDPKFDVTDEVVKGLNARYTKVAKKK